MRLQKYILNIPTLYILSAWFEVDLPTIVHVVPSSACMKLGRVSKSISICTSSYSQL